MKLMEAVPNVSEGRRPDVILAIARRVRAIPGAALLHIDSNADANRTVFTIAGEPQAVRQAAFALLQATAEHIDMRTQHGAHPRLGATDVCPFVPVSGMTLKETAEEAEKLAQEAAEKLDLPIYLYEANAQTPERKNLAFIRRGEYESLPQKLTELPPDIGPRVFSPNTAKTGATVIGARNFLIAFNVSLNTKNVTAAKEIAAALREKNGGLPTVKAIGWLMPGYDCAQVSFNLTDYKKTGLAAVWEAVKQQAEKRGLAVTGSELIGLAPEEALLQAGRFYASEIQSPEEWMAVAVQRLGLNKIRPFNLRERILEYRMQDLL